MSGSIQDFRCALPELGRSQAFPAVAAIALALGIEAVTL
jgi:hypothetical protein